MFKYNTYNQKPSDKLGVKLMKAAQRIDVIRNRKEINFKLLYTSRLSEDFKYPKDILFETINVGGIPVESISRIDEKPKNILIQLHGGAYIYGYNDFYRKNAYMYLKCKNNLKVVSPIYSLAPKKPFPNAFNEVIALYKYLLEQGYKSENIIIAGDSAGGGLAIAVTHYLRDNSIPLPKALITMSAWTNLAMNGESHEKNKYIDPMFGVGSEPLDVYAYVGQYDVLNPYISPLYGSYDQFTDMLMFVGGAEIILSDTLDVAEAAKGNNEVFVHNFLGMFHVFPFGYRKMSSSKKAWEIIQDYIDKKLEG